MALLGTQALCRQLARRLQERQFLLATAESCTGGLIAGACTQLAGSSIWFERGFVTYSNAAKTELLGVDPRRIATDGAVSEAVAIAMAQGALQHSRAQVALAVTGVAGPGGGSVEKPVGTVWLAWATPAGTTAMCCQFSGNRTAVRKATVLQSLRQLVTLLDTLPAGMDDGTR